MKYYTLILLLFIQGCAQWFPANSKEIGPGVFRLQAVGNIFASDKGLLKKIEKKAAKKCGERGHVFIQNEGVKIETQPGYTNTANIETNYKVLTKVAKCN